jgi:type IV pilus assembly protein PilA
MKLAQAIKKGFTLIELLVVIGILAILLAITLIAINPQRQFQQANDTKRKSDVNTILNAVGQYAADNNGALPAGVTGVDQEVSTAGADICTALIPTYIAALPVDPTTGTGDPITTCPVDPATYVTGYNIISTNNRVTVTAPDAQITIPISVTR